MLHQGVTLGNIAVHGRWASESSCREYLRRGELFILRMKTQVDTSVWKTIVTLSSSLFPLLQVS